MIKHIECMRLFGNPNLTVSETPRHSIATKSLATGDTHVPTRVPTSCRTNEDCNSRQVRMTGGEVPALRGVCASELERGDTE